MGASLRIIVSLLHFSILILSADITEEDAIVVIASRTEESPLETAGSTIAITDDELIKRGATNLVDALQRTPGVSVPFDVAGTGGFIPYLQGGSNAINIRGLEGDRVSIQVDGIRQPNDFSIRSFGGTGGPGRIYFDPSTFQQLEIFKSASSNLYGSDALAGSILGRTVTPESVLGDSLEGGELRSTSTYNTANDSFHQRVETAIGNGNHALSLVYSYRNGNELETFSGDENPTNFETNALVLKSTSWWGDLEVTPTFDYFRSDSLTELNSLVSSNPVSAANALVSDNFDFIAARSDASREKTRVSAEIRWESDGGHFF